MLDALYGGSLALLTDLYQLTMAQGYWKTGLSQREAVFHLYFRKNPFGGHGAAVLGGQPSSSPEESGGGFALACGLELAAEYLERLRFRDDDLAYLGSLPASDVSNSPNGAGSIRTKQPECLGLVRPEPTTFGCSGRPNLRRSEGLDGKPLFDPAFLDHLRGLRFACDVDATLEGTAVFAPEPMVRVQGPLLQCQLIETALLNIVNFSTLIATKAARTVLAAKGAPVLEFGLRRAQGIDGAVSASRAAYIGGCAATSNVLAGKLLGIPVKGTHAHSWVMAFEDELEAFQAYAEALPGDCVFLVDTYDTLEGVRRAVEVGRWLKARGRRLAGIRLDSGDLADLSRKARAILDEAGFPDAAIAASNDLDEDGIAALIEKGAAVAVWGVGTRLVTGDGQPALGGVYKLSAIRSRDGSWRDVLKASDGGAKASFPGILQVRRFLEGGGPVRDIIYDVRDALPEGAGQDLLAPVFRRGCRVFLPEGLEAIRQRAHSQLAALPPGVLRLAGPRRYPVEIGRGVAERRKALLEGIRFVAP